MQRTKPKLKVDRIFGPELVPQRKGISVSAWLLALVCAGGMAALYQYATPIWLCYRLEEQLDDAKTADEAGIAAENLLALGDDGLKVVVEALADSRLEISSVAFQVLKSRLDEMTTEELLESKWVSTLAGNLRKSAGSWNGESKNFGCQLASAIYSTYETHGDPQQSDKLRWAPARLDTWAVLENHQWTNVAPPLRNGFQPAELDTSSSAGMLAGSQTGNASIRNSTGARGAEGNTGSMPVLSSVEKGGAPKSPTASIVSSGSSNIVSNGGGTLRSIDYQNRDMQNRVAEPNDQLANADSSESGSAVRIGDLRQTEVGDEPMAHIQVIPKNRRGGSGAVSNAPRGVGAPFTNFGSESQQGSSDGGPSSNLANNGNAGESEAKQWEGNIQRIDTRTPELEAALKQKDVLELFLLLKSENISEQAAAVRELDERGLSDVEIALATSLVRGDSTARIKLLMDLPRMEIADPSRWYIWMAQNEDREVRRVAIQGLGSVADPGIAAMIRELRVHETDRELKDLLQSILKNIER